MMQTHQDLGMQSSPDQAANALFAWQALLYKVTLAQVRYHKSMAAINQNQALTRAKGTKKVQKKSTDSTQCSAT